MKIRQTLIFIASLAVASIALNTSLHAQTGNMYCISSYEQVEQETGEKGQTLDNISEGDDHVRLVKTVLKAQFPNLATTAVSQTSAQMNKLGFETGTIVMFAAGTVPTTETISGVKDWLLCDGAAYSTSTYSALYAVVGAVFGTSGSDFRVPDYRSNIPVGVGDGRGAPPLKQVNKHPTLPLERGLDGLFKLILF